MLADAAAEDIHRYRPSDCVDAAPVRSTVLL